MKKILKIIHILGIIDLILLVISTVSATDTDSNMLENQTNMENTVELHTDNQIPENQETPLEQDFQYIITQSEDNKIKDGIYIDSNSKRFISHTIIIENDDDLNKAAESYQPQKIIRTV